MASSMAQLKLMTQTNVLALPAAQGSRGEANGRAEAKPNGHRPSAVQPPLPVTPQRLELIKACANHALRGAKAPTASQIAQRFAPRAEAGPPASTPHPAPQEPAPFAMLASGIRRLTTLVIIAALLPNLTLAAFWLGLVEPPWSRPGTPSPSESPLKAASTELALPVLSAPAILEATAGEDMKLPIALDGTDGVPAGSVIVVNGLPHGSSLSNGRRHGETGWTLRPDEIGDLYLVLAGGGRGTATLEIELLAPNNGILADAATVLRIAAQPGAAIAAAAKEELRTTLPADEIKTASVPPGAARTDDPTSLAEPVPLPTRRPAPDSNDAGPANWVTPSAYVNLRDGPSSTARVVSVVAKGAKLRIVARQRGWVRVADPANSQSGWIYSSNVETVP